MSVDNEPLDNGVLEIYSLDVGQADAAVMITEEGEIVLNDADKEMIVNELETVLADRPVERTENGNIPLVFAATHLHQDHIKGLDNLGYNEYEISHAIHPDLRRVDILNDKADEAEEGVSEKNVRDYKKHLERLDVGKITQVSCDDKVPIDSDATLRVLAPPTTDEFVDVTRVSTGANVNLPPVRPNENGAVYKLDGERSVLFMGDMQDKSDHYGESWLIQQHDKEEIDLSADMLFVAHHGSANATNPEFLERVDPDTAVISSSLDNNNDHPTDEVLKSLYEYEVDVYWTAGHGTTRTDLNTAHPPDPTTALETTNAADIAALKHYCGEHDVAPEDVDTLAPGNLPEETPGWITTAAPMVAQTPEAIADAAIMNAETTEDVYETLKDHHPANRHLYLAIEDDRTEHVTTAATIEQNNRKREKAERRQAAAQPSWRDRMQSTLPLVPDPDLLEYNGPAPEEIEGPFEEAELPDAVRDSRTAKTMRDDPFTAESPPDYLLAAEEHANNAVNNAENFEDLCEALREHLGTHIDLMKAIKTSETHLSENLVSKERDKAQTISQNQDLSRDEDRGLSL